MVQGVGQQPLRRVVGRHQQKHPAAEQGIEQPGEQHGIANVMYMEFIETQHPAIAYQLVQGRAQCVVQRPVAMHALVQAGKKIMKVQALLGLDRYGLIEAVEQPAFAPADRAVQVQATRLALLQLCQLPGHAVDHPALAIAELITAAVRLVFEPGEQFALMRGSAAQALAKLAQRGRDPGRQKHSSLGIDGAVCSLPEGGDFDQ